MKVSNKINLEAGKVTICLELTEFSIEDMRSLLDRAEKPIDSQLGATLIAANFISGFEAFQQFIGVLSGVDPSTTLEQLRASYSGWVSAGALESIRQIENQ